MTRPQLYKLNGLKSQGTIMKLRSVKTVERLALKWNSLLLFATRCSSL